MCIRMYGPDRFGGDGQLPFRCLQVVDEYSAAQRKQLSGGVEARHGFNLEVKVGSLSEQWPAAVQHHTMVQQHYCCPSGSDRLERNHL